MRIGPNSASDPHPRPASLGVRPQRRHCLAHNRRSLLDPPLKSLDPLMRSDAHRPHALAQPPMGQALRSPCLLLLYPKLHRAHRASADVRRLTDERKRTGRLRLPGKVARDVRPNLIVQTRNDEPLDA